MENVKVNYLKDEEGNIFSPITSLSSVFDNKGVSLENLDERILDITCKNNEYGIDYCTYKIGVGIKGSVYRTFLSITKYTSNNKLNTLDISDLNIFSVYNLYGGQMNR